MNTNSRPRTGEPTTSNSGGDSKRPRLQDNHQLEWLTPSELFERLLDTLRLSSGPPIREKLAELRDGEAVEFDVLARTRQTPEDLALYKEKCEDWKAARNRLLSLVEETFITYGIEGAWLAYGRRSPFHEEELIPPQFWSFMKFDRRAMRAVNEAHGLEFAGLRCLILQDIPKPWCRFALLEIDEAQAAIGNGKSNEQNATNDSDKVLLDQDQKLPLYNRVSLVFKSLSIEDKKQLDYRGGKKKIARLIADQIPDAAFSSIERELRNVLKDQRPT